MVRILYESFIQGDKSQLFSMVSTAKNRDSLTWMLPLSLRAMQCWQDCLKGLRMLEVFCLVRHHDTAAIIRDRCKEVLTCCVKRFAQSNLKCRLGAPTWSPSTVVCYFLTHCTLVITQHGVVKRHTSELYKCRQKHVATGGRYFRDWYI